jgi:UTP-glucose-1-phosphate uridylyltransferase
VAQVSKASKRCRRAKRWVWRLVIVDVINQLRGPDKAELRHADSMMKVERHPGIAQRNFSGGYFDPNGQERPCYYLPKREAELMVMSESQEVQTQVYDRLTVLEAAAVPALPQTYAQALRTHYVRTYGIRQPAKQGLGTANHA